MAEPILVLGMHRSGTKVVARILSQLGVFMGAQLDPNHEAYAFLELNQFVLGQCGARWDHPEGVAQLMESDRVRRLMREYLAYMIVSPAMRRYTGNRIRGGLGDLGSWGWKDPRTLLVLPLWLELFPGARLVHVRRHGVDVAASLRERHRAVLDRAMRSLEHGRLFSWKQPNRPFIDTLRAGTLEGAFDLWELYLDVAARHLTGRDVLELRYETLVDRPASEISRLSQYLALSPPAGAESQAIALVDAGRALAHRHDDELTAFAGRVSERLAFHGYSPPPHEEPS